MGVEVVKGVTHKTDSSDKLARALSARSNLSGQLFIGYPTVPTPEGAYTFDALFASNRYGLVIFDLIEDSELGNFIERQDDSANNLESILKRHRPLLAGRSLRIPINTMSFAPNGTGFCNDNSEHWIASDIKTLNEGFKKIRWSPPNENVYAAAISAIEGISSIRKSKRKRSTQRADSRGAKLRNLEDSIATLDNQQCKAVIETADGIQRIRGLAGSGKTIVLALKAAYLHAQNPEWRIAVTFYTRSLKELFRQLINNFSISQTGREPDWDNIQILNAWGGPGGKDRDGIYHNFCHEHDLKYMNFRTAAVQFTAEGAFANLCEQALEEARNIRQLYDIMLIDEAQDLPPSFLRLCYAMISEPKRLVYAYDELQNLSKEPLPSPEEIFCKSESARRTWEPAGEFPSVLMSDIVLEKCYRNSRPVLVTAHSLGFGIYRPPPKPGDTGLVQMFQNSQLWRDIGYRSRNDELIDGAQTTLYRTTDTSPRFLEAHSDPLDLIKFMCFDTKDDQAEWIAEEIFRNLNEDELQHDDIVVVNPDPRTTKDEVGPIRKRLWDMKINSHLAGEHNPDIFFQPSKQSVTFSGVHRAKGNEAGMVYVINSQDCNIGTLNLARLRNRLFTAITRSKAWVRVIGVGRRMKELVSEFEKLRESDFRLEFKYPTKEERKDIMIIHRDTTSMEAKAVAKGRRSLSQLREDIEKGDIRSHDLIEEFDKLNALMKQSP